MEEKIENIEQKPKATELSLTERIEIADMIYSKLCTPIKLIQIGETILDKEVIKYLWVSRYFDNGNIQIEIVGHNDQKMITAYLPFSTDASELPPAENGENTEERTI